jgi:hypothetical protein
MIRRVLEKEFFEVIREKNTFQVKIGEKKNDLKGKINTL